MRKLYSVDEHRDYRRVRPEIIALAVFLLLALGSAIYITLDLRRNQTVIDESNNTPVLGEVLPADDEFKTIEADTYFVDVPENWTKVVSPEYLIDGSRYYPDRYQGTSGDNAGRVLEVYHDTIPVGIGVTKILEVSVIDEQINPIEISPQCRGFTDSGDEENPAGNPYPSKWNDIDFICRTSLSLNIVAAREPSDPLGLSFDDKNGDDTYLLVYTDHGSDLDNSIFFEILERFERK